MMRRPEFGDSIHNAAAGDSVSSDRLRAALRCTVCGHRGGLIQLQSWSKLEFRQGPPLDQIPLTLRRWMFRDALRGIGAEIESP